MSNLKFVKSGVIDTKTKLVILKDEMISISPSYSSGKIRIANVEGQNYFIVNTATDPLEYGKVVLSKGMSQKTALGSQCLMIAQWYALEIMSGNTSSYNDYLNLSGSPSTKINNSIKSQDIGIIKNGLFDFLNNGYPAVIKVSRTSSGRHYVTAIGYKNEVKNASDLNENNILVLDNASGKISTLADSGYGNRKFYAEQNQFEVIGPNNEFIKRIQAKENSKKEA